MRHSVALACCGLLSAACGPDPSRDHQAVVDGARCVIREDLATTAAAIESLARLEVELDRLIAEALDGRANSTQNLDSIGRHVRSLVLGCKDAVVDGVTYPGFLQIDFGGGCVIVAPLAVTGRLRVGVETGSGVARAVIDGSVVLDGIQISGTSFFVSDNRHYFRADVTMSQSNPLLMKASLAFVGNASPAPGGGIRLDGTAASSLNDLEPCAGSGGPVTVRIADLEWVPGECHARAGSASYEANYGCCTNSMGVLNHGHRSDSMAWGRTSDGSIDVVRNEYWLGGDSSDHTLVDLGACLK